MPVHPRLIKYLCFCLISNYELYVLLGFLTLLAIQNEYPSVIGKI